jgi:transketolase C-terminal domain/subunit
MLYRCLDVVERLKSEGVRVALVNKPTLNVVDDDMLKKIADSGFVMVVETQNTKSGLGSRFGTWLLERGYHTAYAHLGVTKEGHGGLSEQVPYQGMGPADIRKQVQGMLAR